MSYAKQTWADGDATKPVSAARMQHLEDGLDAIANAGSRPYDYSLRSDGATVTAYDKIGVQVSSGADLGAILNALAASNITFVLGAGSFPASTRASFSGLTNLAVLGLNKAATIIVGSGSQEVMKWTAGSHFGHCGDLTIQCGASNTIGVSFAGSTDCTAERITTTGGTTNGVAADATSHRARVIRCAVSTATKDGIALAGDDSLADLCVVTSCGDGSVSNQGGINVSGGSRTKLWRCRTDSNAQHGIYAANCDYIDIQGCTSRLNGTSSFSALGGRGVTFGGTIYGPKLIGNILESNTENGVLIPSGVTDPVVANNIAKNNNTGTFAGGHGFEVNSTGGQVLNNVSTGNNCGISCNGSFVTIAGNRCYSNVTGGSATFGNGIKLFDAADCTVEANICNGNTGSGIDVNGSATFVGPTISGNRCKSNGSNGITVNSKAQGGVYADNKCASNTSTDFSIADTTGARRNNFSGSDAGNIRNLTYSASISVTRSEAEILAFTVTDGVAFTINSPESNFAGRFITFVILNSSGGAMGAITWNVVYKLAGAFTNPANGTRRTITFFYNGANYIETARAAADI